MAEPYYALRFDVGSYNAGDEPIYVASTNSPNRWTNDLDDALIIGVEDQGGHWDNQYVEVPVVLTSEGWEKIHE